MTVHHEMLAPLRGNIEICARLVKQLKNNEKASNLAKIVFVSSQMIMLHANDMLDQRIIENKKFTATLTISHPIDAIKEIANLVS